MNVIEIRTILIGCSTWSCSRIRRRLSRIFLHQRSSINHWKLPHDTF